MSEKTVQVRRYQFLSGDLPKFIDWWQHVMVPTREAYGYTIEFGAAVPDRNEFIWAVSLPLSREDFLAKDAEWNASPERAAALASAVPLTKQRISLVDRLR